jgi:hypothetical protein
MSLFRTHKLLVFECFRLGSVGRGAWSNCRTAANPNRRSSCGRNLERKGLCLESGLKGHKLNFGDGKWFRH